MIDKYPECQEIMNKYLSDFKKNDEERSKDVMGDIGEYVVILAF